MLLVLIILSTTCSALFSLSFATLKPCSNLAVPVPRDAVGMKVCSLNKVELFGGLTLAVISLELDRMCPPAREHLHVH